MTDNKYDAMFKFLDQLNERISTGHLKTDSNIVLVFKKIDDLNDKIDEMKDGIISDREATKIDFSSRIVKLESERGMAGKIIHYILTIASGLAGVITGKHLS